MSKLPPHVQFTDLSDYGRPVARGIVKLLLPTSIGAKTVTLLFLLVGILAVILIIREQSPLLITLCLILKSILDAADGELARARKEPSYVGRYFDSLSDILINILLFAAIWYTTEAFWLVALLSWLSFQLQGSLYNYYYCIKRHANQGDKTSRIKETSMPPPYERDNPVILSIFFRLYEICYGWQDNIIHKLDPKAIHLSDIPAFFMTAISIFGLGFQLLVIGLCLCLGFTDWLFLWFLIPSNIVAIGLISYRRLYFVDNPLQSQKGAHL